MANTFARTIIRVFKLLFFLLIIAALSGLYLYNTNLKAVTTSVEMQNKDINIPKGASVKTIAAILKDEGIIKDNITFWAYCRLNNKSSKFQAGNYTLNNSMTVPEVVEKLTTGQANIETNKFTIPEGYELRMIADRLTEEKLVDKAAFEEALNNNYDYEFLKDLPDRENKLEGYLFPDTYEIYKDAKPADIVNKMLEAFATIVYTDEFKARAKELGMTTDQIIIMASIIEREAKHDDERATIAGVFYNRIKKGMLLQSCATVQYILKERKDVLTFKDLEIESSYNTYKYAGLPPGPIASPGLKSIEAALYPETTDYLYFVAKPDGSHVFTKTYKEHLQAQNNIKKEENK